jgi:hypothetical protein
MRPLPLKFDVMIRIKKYCTLHQGECQVNGRRVYVSDATDVKELLAGIYHALDLDYLKFFKMDVLAKAGFLAAEMLLQDEEPDENTGLFFANSFSSLDTDSNYQETIGEDYFPSPKIFVYTLANIVLGEICIRHKIYGENLFLIGRNMAESQIVAYAREAFEAGNMRHALVAWLDVCGSTCEVTALLVDKVEEGMELTEENINHITNK